MFQMSGCRARQNQPSTFSMCMITKAMHAVVIENELYISYVIFKASLNYWSKTEWAWMRVWLSFWGSFSHLPLQPPALYELGGWEGVVVVVGNCCGSESGTYMLLIHPILSSPFVSMVWMNVAWKASGLLLAGNGLSSLSWDLLLLLLLILLLIYSTQGQGQR